MFNIFKRNNKSLNYGKYKINYNIKKNRYNQFVQLVNNNTVLNADEKEVKLVTKNIEIILDYQIKSFTNLSDYVDMKNINKILETEDEEMKKVLEYLRGMILYVLKKYKTDIEIKMKDIEKLVSKINNKKEQL